MTTSTGSPRRRQTVNTRRRVVVAAILLLLIVISLSLALAGPGQSSSNELSGSVLLWHSLSGAAADTLQEVIGDYEDLNPNIKVYQRAFTSEDELLTQYQDSVESGLGPDLVLGNAAWITTLAPKGSIRSIDDEVSDRVVSQYLPASVESVTFDGKLYGQPLSLHIPALYYNTKYVDTPPDTLDALVTQAAEGHTVLMSTDFQDALWGIQAFGGKFFDEDGRAILDQGGYANWLDWLMTARSAPGMILDSSRASLQESFLQGDASYYVGYPEEVDVLIDGLGADNLGVAPLPSGPTGRSGPFLGVDTLLFSPVSSEGQQKIAADLANFITNAEQSSTFMREARMVPANTGVRINARLFPLTAGFLTQARSAVALPSSDTTDAMWAIAENAYSRAMNGLSSPLEVAAETTAAINKLNGFESVAKSDVVCTDLGTVRLAHEWEGADAEALNAIIDRFRQMCPLVIVNPQFADLEEVRAAWKENPTAATNPDLVLASQEWLIDALQDEIQLHDINDKVPSETLQRFLPAALSGMKQGVRLLGLPMSIRVNVLYYNKELVSDPADVLDQLRQQAADGVPVTLTAAFIPAYWGIGAFGGRLFDANGLPALDEGGFADWLSWLKQSRDDHGVQIVYDNADAESAFLDGSTAYYVGDPDERTDLVAGLGEDNLGIALLPAGPNGDATPLFTASGLFFNENMSDSRLAAALGFALFATNAESQGLLVNETERVPANATVDPSDHAHVMTYLDQARSASPLPNQPQVRDVLTTGDQAYQAVLADGIDPDQAVADVMRQINALYNIEPETSVDASQSGTTSTDGQATTPEATTTGAATATDGVTPSPEATVPASATATAEGEQPSADTEQNMAAPATQ